ncbi:MAG: redox-sensing transcriptional repressor Rex [Chloroflexi bacterium]|nr:redox-sensing transcriptional repressor Rex [Chloroflexota bacterium]
MATVRKPGIPVPSLRRLPIYYRLLTAALEQGVTCISSEELGSEAGVPGAQVRKDLSYLPEYGRPGVGYDTRALAGYLEEFLGLVNDKEAILVGAGNLGRALMSYPGFERYGLEIIAVFDRDQDKVGQVIAGHDVLPVAKLPDLAKRLHVQMGIICVPADQAQHVAVLMVQGGVDVIWNFAPCHLSVPENVLVKDEDLAAELATLSHHITQRKLAAQMRAEATASKGAQVERTD